MQDVNENQKTGIDTKIKEAETYRSQGLFSESLEIYEGILSEAPDLDPDIRKNIFEKIDLIKTEIKALEQRRP